MFLSARSLALFFAALFCAGALGAQNNAVRAVELGPQIISRSAGETVTVDFGLKPLVHGPYVLAVLNLDAPDATIRLNGTEIFKPEDFSILEISKPVTLTTANTLEVTFDDDRRDSSVIVSITGWEYMYANAYPSSTFTAVPEDVDWRSKGAVTPVKNQGTSCPASWAFSTTGVVEGYSQVSQGTLHSLSEQQILDCSGVQSCFYGNTDLALKYVLKAGLASEADYPYTGRIGACKKVTDTTTINGFTRLAIGDEGALGAAVDEGPVSVVINGNWFSSYTGGIVNLDCESKIPVFASVLVVGFTDDYWIVKNSLGTSWGEAGYFRIVRGQNACGIADYALHVH